MGYKRNTATEMAAEMGENQTLQRTMSLYNVKRSKRRTRRGYGVSTS